MSVPFKVPANPRTASRYNGPVPSTTTKSGVSRFENPHQRRTFPPDIRDTKQDVVPPEKTATRSLMDMDDTLLGGVDFNEIEQHAHSRSKSRRLINPADGQKSVLSEHLQPHNCYESPKRKVARQNEPENRFQMQSPKLTFTQQLLRRSSQKPSAPIMVSREPTTVDPFGWDSQIFSLSEIQQLETRDFPEGTASKQHSNVNVFNMDQDNAKEPEPDDDAFPCYQLSNDEDFLNCSQLLLDEADRLGSKHVTRFETTLKSGDSSFSIVQNNVIGSQYIRMERSMLEENAANLVDDQLDSQLIREFDCPSQHRREIDNVFDQFERTLTDVSNIQQDAVENRNGEMVPSQVVANIDWEEDVTIAGPKLSASSNRSMLKTIFNKKAEEARKAAIERPVESPKRVARKSAPLVSSYFKDKGPFFGLPLQIKQLLTEYRGITEMYGWQKECLGLPAIVERNNLIYALPTSGGKTLVAEIIMFREVLLRSRNAMFIVPYVSLAQEKLAALSPFAVTMGFLVEEYSGGKGVIPPRKRRKKNSIFVCTIEKALVLLDSLIEADRANEIGLVVIDELHMIGGDRRGVNLEILITKIQAIQAGIQIVGMSATIGNLDEIAKFMTADIYCRDFRPVELKEYVKCGTDLLEINNGARKLEDAFRSKQTLDFGYSEAQRRIDPDHLIGLVVEVVPSGSCLIFCPTKRQCEQLCALLTEHLPRELTLHRAAEKEELIKSLQADGSLAPLLPPAFQLGIAYHHSGLTFDERKLIEDGFRTGILSCIICTSTLAAGVNLPAKRVIIRSPFIASNFLSLSRYKQMVGRAGRAGFGDETGGDSILICAPKDIRAVCDLLCSPMDEANSSLHVDDFISLKNLILSSVGLGICATRNDIQKFVRRTLLAIQAGRLGVNFARATDQAIQTLYRENAIKARNDGCTRNPANMTIRIDGSDDSQLELEGTQTDTLNVIPGAKGSSQEGRVVKMLKKTSRLEVNRLGKAAIRAGFHMEKAIRFYDELKRVGERLNVLDELHLLYIVVLEDGGEVRPTDSDYVLFFDKISNEDTLIAKRFHIGDFTISKILSRRTVPADIQPTIRRFYRVLMVYDLWNLRAPQQVALKYKVDAGSIQTLMSNTASTAACLHRMCEELPELWAFRQLFAILVPRLAHCCTAELVPLMELPAVKIGRARQLFRAGFTSITSIAKAKSRDLVESVEHMNYRTANQLILSAKAKLMEEMEALKDQANEYLQVLEDR
ncbi:helicase POLQ-like isoform X2 [Uranotaenia lowii]|uniref:helicase POLQ-like isoform X2 n=1 Tax=Uranotaenia lowii TaxID=190385 RepID=UPI00247A186A|nr:helicase POLQ-like isoform X2 [Uranotaenia lowii]